MTTQSSPLSSHAPNEYLAGMRDLYPHLCWMVNGDGSQVCVSDKGHDNGVHEAEPAGFYSEEVAASDPIRLPDLVRRAFAYPRFLSIGAIDNGVEIRMSREVYEEIKVIVGRPRGE